MEIHLKRVYEENDPNDGFRVLADRLWPRGIKKEALALDLWAKEIAPSTELRKRYHQDTYTAISNKLTYFVVNVVLSFTELR